MSLLKVTQLFLLGQLLFYSTNISVFYLLLWRQTIFETINKYLKLLSNSWMGNANNNNKFSTY